MLRAGAGPALRTFADHWPRSGWGAAHIGADVDEADNAIIRADIEGRLDRFVVRGFACAPKGTEALSKSRKHEAVSRTPGGDALLDDWNLRGPVASRRDHDDEGSPERLLPLSGQRLAAGDWVSPG